MRRTTEIRSGARVDVCTSDRASGVEVHLTATPTDGSRAGAAELLEATAAALAERGAEPMAEKLYGPVGAKADVLGLRDSMWRRHGLDPAVPVTWIEGGPLAGEALVGAQIWAEIPRVGAIRTVDAAGARGRIWEAPGFRVLHLASITAAGDGDPLPAGGPAQAAAMFARAKAALAAHGLGFRAVARTWIYLARLLDWYGDLNRVRTAFFAAEGVGEGGAPFPASTGIQGRTGDEECVIDVLAVDAATGGPARGEPVHESPRQDSSFRYGSAFSRGMVVAIDGVRTVHVSGTASIDRTGKTTHLGDAEMQSVETLLSTAAILEAQGGSLADVTSATLYCKDAAAFAAWERVTKLLRVPAFPRVSVLADVCRDDLLVEMECVAVLGDASAR